MKTFILLTFTATILSTITGCATCSAQTNPPPSGQNPASTFCTQQGGTVVIAKDSQGSENGICKLSQAMLPEWTLFRELVKGEKTIAIQKFLSGSRYEPNPGRGTGMPNPASYNCSQFGGNLELYSVDTGQFGVCKFQDKSGIEEWTLYRGPSDARNALLTSLVSATTTSTPATPTPTPSPSSIR